MTQIDWPAGIDAFEVVCRLGTYTGDGADAGDLADLATQGGTVTIVQDAPRWPITDPEGVRAITMAKQTFSVVEGRLVDAQGRVGLKLPLILGMTWTAYITPDIGYPWSVTFAAQPGVVDLGTLDAVKPSLGPSEVQRLGAVESILSGLTGAAVQSVAGRTGDVALSASDVSGLAPVATAGTYASLTGKPIFGTAATTDSTAYATAAQGAPLVNAHSITGVVADGLTDCTAPLNAWLASPPAGAAGLWFPPGTIVASLKVTSPNLTIAGTRGAIIKVPTAATLHDNDAGIRILADGVTIEGLSIDGNRDGNPTINSNALAENSDGIGIYGNNATVRNVHIYNAIGHGIIVWGLAYKTVVAAGPRSGYLIHGNIVEGGPYRAAIDVAFNQHATISTRGVVSNNNTVGNTFILHSSNDVAVTGNTFGAGVSIHTGCERITLTGNSSPGQNINLLSGKDITATGNVCAFLNVKLGTGTDRSQRITVASNVVTGLIFAWDADAVSVRGNSTPGVDVQRSTDAIVEGNLMPAGGTIKVWSSCVGVLVSGNLGGRITVNGATGVDVVDNRVTGATSYGIYVDDSSSVTIAGNVVDSAVTDGIKAGINAATPGLVVADNVIRNAVTGMNFGPNCTTLAMRNNLVRGATTEAALASAILPTLVSINNAGAYGRIIVPPASLMAPGVTAAAWPAANRAIFSRFTLGSPSTLRYFRFTVGVQSGNIQVGVVKFRPGSATVSDRVMNSGVIACPATGTQVIDLGAYTAGPGDYAAFIWADSTTFTTPWATVAQTQSMRLSSIVSSQSAGVDTSVTHNESVGWALSGVAIEAA